MTPMLLKDYIQYMKLVTTHTVSDKSSIASVVLYAVLEAARSFQHSTRVHEQQM